MAGRNHMPRFYLHRHDFHREIQKKYITPYREQISPKNILSFSCFKLRACGTPPTSKKVTTFCGVPGNFLRSSSFCVVTPTGQLFVWQIRAMMQPSAIMAIVPNLSRRQQQKKFERRRGNITRLFFSCIRMNMRIDMFILTVLGKNTGCASNRNYSRTKQKLRL